MGVKQDIEFDDSGLIASLNYVRNSSEENLQKLVSAAGNRLAYAHHSWSSPDERMTLEEFWTTQLSKVSWSPELEQNINTVKTYLLKQERTKWLTEVLRYLPNEHSFNTIVYLNLGYDDIVFGENVALNLNSPKFSVDKREAVYYLIHELAHAGYVRYHGLPQLENFSTNGELLDVVKFLTHLEGMGVLSAFRLRLSEGGLRDNDYKVLLNEKERIRRIDQYFELFDELNNNPDQKIEEYPSRILGKMSGRETRLWYITGCHMAQEIEKRLGRETLRELVRLGSQAFFETYLESAQN